MKVPVRICAGGGRATRVPTAMVECATPSGIQQKGSRAPQQCSGVVLRAPLMPSSPDSDW